MDVLVTAEKPAPAKQPVTEEVREKKRQLMKRFEALKTERSEWMTRWRDIGEHIRPGGFRERREDANRGDAKHGKIINFTPLESARTLASGMMAGITSPSRPWFRLVIEGDSELSDDPEVKSWLTECEKVLKQDMARSNAYKALHVVYADLGPFGTAAMLVEEDAEDGARCYVFPVGSFVLATSPRGDVDTIIRQTTYTVAQLVKDFGPEVCSDGVKRLYEEKQLDTRIAVCHAITPNDDLQAGAVGPRGFAWSSFWWEESGGPDVGFLRQSGYYERPHMCPRWEVTGEDVYGRGPGHAAINDCKALQLLERRSAQAVDKVVTPPMAAPTAAQQATLSLIPGGVSFVDGLGAGQGLRPAYQVDPAAVQTFELKIERHERRIRKAFFADLWLMLSESTGQMTAREVSERREEKLLQLGTVLEALNDELLDPLVDRFFDIAFRQGRIPPPPDVLQGKAFKPEYISIMAQAQKLLSTTGLERIALFVGNLAAIKPDVLDKMDFDQLIDEISDALGVPPAIIRPDEAVEALRQARAQAQQQQAAIEQQAQAAQTAKTLADTDTGSDNALTEMMRGLSVR